MWLERNNRIFSAKYDSTVFILRQINNIVHLWSRKEQQIQELDREDRQAHSDPRRRLDLLELAQPEEGEGHVETQRDGQGGMPTGYVLSTFR